MDVMELMRSRHSVRQYLDTVIPDELRQQLSEYAGALNRESGLHMQILYDEPLCFNSLMAHYGRFVNVRNYIALVGRKEKGLEERCGFYGEKMVLKAQELGLNTCWVAFSHGKSHAVTGNGEKEVVLIALGYGRTSGTGHRIKSPSDVSNISEDSPEWFRKGIEAALLAPTALNQQRFRIEHDGRKVSSACGLLGSNLKVSLGIARCHFELAAGPENFEWV
ncbi:nitroreductase family protein [Ruminobacter sp. RM87]|uniref:nitroreductase family protein n=1 Tax=Ruminobacter sp. RM87 TaxID=1200567 RepID=UPI0004E0FEA8|nr:nitroreductase family protein [Ruminobacter sp. RM87]